MLETVGQFRLQYSDQAQGVLGSLVATPSLLSKVIESQGQDAKISSIRDRVAIPQLIDLREEILKEFYYSHFAVHTCGTKMYQDHRHQYYWNGMKRHVGNFFQRCLTC